jgi:hypothetical protein
MTQPATAPKIGATTPDGTMHGEERIEPCIGAIMTDGTVCAGISPDTGKTMYAMAAAAPLTMTFNEAAKYAKTINTQKAFGHDDWHVPTKAEFNVMFNNRAAIGGFDVSGSYPAGWYWSSRRDVAWGAWGQRFSDGYQTNHSEDDRSSVRLVRSGP